ncbi:MAG: DUF4126 domain-containing protein [Chloroflexota bacterium]
MELLLSILPLSLSSGINLYLTLFALGVTERAGWYDLPEAMDIVATLPVMAVSGVLLLVEFFADKIPYVDNVWDFLHTFVRPAGALLLAMGFIPADDPELRTAVMLLAGTTALTAHGSKASFRALVNTSPEPVSNSVVSVLEDTLVLGMIALFITYPLIATGVSIVLLVGLVIALVLIFRWARRVFGSVRDFLMRRPIPQPEVTT